jgi:LacI family transcriptional regulator
MTASRPLRIALLVETSTSWGTQIIRGVAEFGRRHGSWSLSVEPRGRDEQQLLPGGWQGDGIIARVTSRALAAQIRQRSLPAVNVSWYPYQGPTLARCIIDEEVCAQLAVQHFLDRSLTHFGYCPAAGRPARADPLGKAFQQRLARAGFRCACYPQDPRPDSRPNRPAAGLSRWLQALPKPVGVLAFTDARGRQLTEACRAAALAVPDEVAVLGGEYDELMSAVSEPSLSSLDFAPQRIGFEAARLLQQMIAGQPCPREPLRIPPLGIITRRSTDTLAVEDEAVSRALRFIRAHFQRPIQVKDVLREVDISRRGLEQRFRALLGRSPAGEIRRARLDHAQRLLADTHLAVPQVAVASGFAWPEVLTHAFRRAFGISPTAYRQRKQVGG